MTVTNEPIFNETPDVLNGRDRVADNDVRSYLEQFNSGDIFQGLGDFDFSADEDSEAQGGELLGEQDTADYPEMDLEKAVAALKSIPNLNASKRRTKSSTLRTFTEDDFEEGAERESFRCVKANVNALFDKKLKPENRVKAIEYIFGRSYAEHPMSFERCCLVLGSRKDVFRLRIHFEFWRQWIAFPFEFPFLIDPVPESIEGHIYISAGDEGYDLARAAWLQPGIRTADLIENASGGQGQKSYVEALEILSAKYLMSQQNDCWYLTGRNPVLRAIDLSTTPYRPSGNNISWSKMF